MKIRIKELRTEAGLRQKDLAEMLGISPQSLGYYENSVNKPDPEMLIKIADFFKVSVGYLLGHEDEYGAIYAQGEFSEDETKLIDDYRKLDDGMKNIARKTLSCWVENK